MSTYDDHSEESEVHDGEIVDEAPAGPLTLEEMLMSVEEVQQENLNTKDLAVELQNAIRESNPGAVDVASFLSFLRNAQGDSKVYEGLDIDEETAVKMRNHLISMKHGTYAAVPLVCPSIDRCPIAPHCYFSKLNPDGSIDKERSRYPIGRPCPVEMSVMQIKIQQYAKQHFGEGTEDISPTNIAFITKLAELDIYEIRADMILAGGHHKDTKWGMNLMVETVEAVSQATGEVIAWGVKEHPILAVKEKFQKQREAILKQLIATPEAKLNARHKLGLSKASNDVSTRLADLSNQLKTLQAQSENSTKKPQHMMHGIRVPVNKFEEDM